MIYMKFIIKLVKRIFLSVVMLYCFNLLISSLNLVIPINYLSITVVSILGIFGLGALALLYFLI